MKFVCRMVAVLAAAASLAGACGCGGGSDAKTVRLPPGPRKLDITLDGYQGPENVGILMAYERGYFEKAGLEIWIRTPQSRLRPLPYVAGGEVALAISHQPQVVLAQDKGAPVAAFGSLIPQPTAAMIWLKKSNIGGIADLKGKTIAFTGLPFEEGMLKSILARAGLTLADVKVVRADYELVPELVSGHADAILGSSNVEGAELKARGLDPVITPVEKLGIPSYEELVLIARTDRLEKEAPWIRAFMTALARGTAAAVEDPEEAARLIASYRAENLSKSTMAAVEATLPLLSETGEMNPDQASQLVEWMHGEGLIQGEPSASKLLTNEFVAQP